MSTRESSPTTLVLNAVALWVLLAVTVVCGHANLGRLNTVIALAIASAKTILVALIFMNLRYGSGLNRLFATVGLIWLIIMFAITLGDYFTRPGGGPAAEHSAALQREPNSARAVQAEAVMRPTWGIRCPVRRPGVSCADREMRATMGSVGEFSARSARCIRVAAPRRATSVVYIRPPACTEDVAPSLPDCDDAGEAIPEMIPGRSSGGEWAA